MSHSQKLCLRWSRTHFNGSPLKIFVTLFVFSSFLTQVHSQHIDEISFGNAPSETAHGLTTYNPSKVETYTGQDGQTAKRFLPDNTNPYQGTFTGTYGGEISFVIRVDGNKQNYFTVKFGGNEYNSGRLYIRGFMCCYSRF